MREKLKKLLITHEGLRLKVYRCTSGKRTIGVGRNLDDKGLSAAEKIYLGVKSASDLTEITETQAYHLLANDINEVINQLNTNLKWYANAPDTVKIVLADMCFNMGLKGLLTFKNTLKYIETGDYKKAAINMEQSLWVKQVKGRSTTLINMIKNI